MRGLSGTQAFAIICLVDGLTTGALVYDLQYLKSHRPATPDAERGFVLRQEVRDGQAFYESAHDQRVYWGLIGLEIAVSVVSGGVAVLYVKARQRKERASALR